MQISTLFMDSVFENMRDDFQRWVFSCMHRYLWEKGEFSKPMTEHPVQQAVDKEEAILLMVDSSVHECSFISQQTLMPWMREWKTQLSGYYPFHRNDQLIPHLLFTGVAMFTRDRIMNYTNSHSWALENPNKTNKTHLQHRFYLNIWSWIIDNRLIGPFVFEYCLLRTAT
jgi:hypothetical protein